MRKENGSAPGRAAEPDLLKVNAQHSTTKSRKNQGVFVADRQPEHVLQGQPFWRFGSTHYVNETGRLVEVEALLSLCASCGAPFITTTPNSAAETNFNRRCEQHRRPGLPVREFRPRWMVGRGAE